jgi:hypothetical protein
MNKQLLFLRCKKLLLLSCILTGLSVYGQNKSAPVPNSVPAFNVSGQLTPSPVDLGLQIENPAMYEYKKAEQLKAGTLTEEERLISSESSFQVPKSRQEELQLKLMVTQDPAEKMIIEKELNSEELLYQSSDVNTLSFDRKKELIQKLSLTNDQNEINLIQNELEKMDKSFIDKSVTQDKVNVDAELINKISKDSRFQLLSSFEKDAVLEKVTNGADFESLISGL